MRRAILAAGLLLIVIGLAAMVNGWSIILVERGWAQFIAGSMLLSAGAILAAISEVVARLDTVTQGMARPVHRPAAPALVQPPMVQRPPQTVPEALPSPQDMPVPMPTAIPAPLPPFVPSMPASELATAHAATAEAPPLSEPVVPEPAPVEPPVPPPAIEPAQKGRIGIGALAGAAGAAAVGTAIFGRRLETAVKPAEPVAHDPLPAPAPEPAETLSEALHDQPVVAEHLPEPAVVEAPAPIQSSTIDPSEALKRLEAEIGGALFGTMPAAPLQEKPEEKSEEQPEELRDTFEQKHEEKLPEDQQDEPRDELDQKPDLFTAPPAEPVAHDPLPPSAPEPVEHTAHETIAVEHVRLVEEAAPPPVEPALAALPQTEEVDELAWLDAALRGIELPKEPEWVTRPEPAVDTAPVAEPVQPATPVSAPDHAAIMRSIEERLEHALLDDLPEAEPAPHEPAAAPEPQPEAHPIVDPVPEHVPESIAEQPTPVSEVAAAEAAQEPEAVAEPDPTIVRRYESQGVVYTLYDNGSVDAETPSGVFHFKSLDELREFLAKPA